MMLPTRLTAATILPLALAASFPGCSREETNPFANPQITRALPAGAAIVFTSNLDEPAKNSRDAYALDADGTGLTRLTFCANAADGCDNVEVAISPDRTRTILRRAAQDTNRDGRIDESDAKSLVYVDLNRSVEAELVPASADVTGVDWTPSGGLLVYSGAGVLNLHDLWRVDPNGQNPINLTSTNGVSEHRPRVDPTGTVALFERVDESGKGRVYLFVDSNRQTEVTSGGPGSEQLPGTRYVVGYDADPDYSPDGSSIVFRRLTGTGVGGRGSWDLLTLSTIGDATPAVIAGGASFRGAPDWGPDGILFVEGEGQQSRLVVLQPDGTGKRVLLTQAAPAVISYPRWLR